MQILLRNIFFMLGILFLVNAIFGRYLVLPGYLQSLENGLSQGHSIPEGYPVWKIVRYLIWAFSFKFGVYFILIGALINSAFSRKTILLVSFLGFFYIATAYLPLPGPISLVFGIGGLLMTICICLVFLLTIRDYNSSDGMKDKIETTYLFQLLGYYFFAMASYNLCPLLGIKCFALYPEKMIQYGMQADAASFATHILLELTLGWTFLFMSWYFQAKIHPCSKQ